MINTCDHGDFILAFWPCTLVFLKYMARFITCSKTPLTNQGCPSLQTKLTTNKRSPLELTQIISNSQLPAIGYLHSTIQQPTHPPTPKKKDFKKSTNQHTFGAFVSLKDILGNLETLRWSGGLSTFTSLSESQRDLGEPASGGWRWWWRRHLEFLLEIWSWERWRSNDCRKFEIQYSISYCLNCGGLLLFLPSSLDTIVSIVKSNSWFFIVVIIISSSGIILLLLLLLFWIVIFHDNSRPHSLSSSYPLSPFLCLCWIIFPNPMFLSRFLGSVLVIPDTPCNKSSKKPLFFRVCFFPEEVGKVTVSFSFPSGSLDLMKKKFPKMVIYRSSFEFSWVITSLWNFEDELKCQRCWLIYFFCLHHLCWWCENI